MINLENDVSTPVKPTDELIRAEPAATASVAGLDECAANGNGHSFGPHGPRGERQCEWCGAASPAAPVAPDGRLHADGYFTWARRDGYVLDRKLPCDFWLTPPAPSAPTVQPLTLRQLATVTAPWAHIWSDESIGIAQATERACAAAWGITLAGITAAPTTPPQPPEK